jgi:hypothetical protein
VIVWLAAPLVALAVLAAHLWRSGGVVLAIVSLAAVGLVLVRRRWSARVLQAVLALGTIEWLRTLAALVAARQSMGLPYTRLALIIGAVAVATALAAHVFELRPMRVRYAPSAR